jgi:hypothetical protein
MFHIADVSTKLSEWFAVAGVVAGVAGANGADVSVKLRHVVFRWLPVQAPAAAAVFVQFVFVLFALLIIRVAVRSKPGAQKQSVFEWSEKCIDRESGGHDKIAPPPGHQ